MSAFSARPGSSEGGPVPAPSPKPDRSARASALLSQQRAGLESMVSEIFSALDSHHVEPPDRHLVASVAVICGSSRGGTSLLFRELARSPHLVSPRGEHVHFEKLYLPGPAQGGSDRLDADSNMTQGMADGMWAALAQDLGSGAPLAQVEDPDLYALELATRFPLQWPSRVMAADALAAAAATSHAWRREYASLPAPVRSREGPPSQSPGSGEAEAFCGAVRDRLAATNGIDPRYYDGAADMLGGTAEPPAGPPDPTVLIEEPPFVVPLPRRRLAPEVAIGKTLLLKSSVMAYRLPVLQCLFPRARVHLIHVRRNPAAAINGLIEGWHHWGFFSHNVEDLGSPLRIVGYSDRYPWGASWWNFDLPPGWQRLVGARLADVCAFQWASAHEAILEYVERTPDIRYTTVDFEDVISGPSSRQRLYDRITEFLSIPRISAGPGRMPPRPVMATSPPGSGRWRRNADCILPALSEPFVSEVARRQGYDVGEIDQWI
jgi:hypothetical protein